MKIFGLLPLLFVAQTETCFASDMFGVLSTDGKSTCLATAGKIDSFPLHVKVALPGETEGALVGVITAPLKEPCEALAKADLGGHFYLLGVIKGLEPWRLGVVQLSGESKAQFRACTSGEGVHLTAWKGKSLKGTRLWHEYIYLGYDVEPTCSERDYEE